MGLKVRDGIHAPVPDRFQESSVITFILICISSAEFYQGIFEGAAGVPVAHGNDFVNNGSRLLNNRSRRSWLDREVIAIGLGYGVYPGRRCDAQGLQIPGEQEGGEVQVAGLQTHGEYDGGQSG